MTGWDVWTESAKVRFRVRVKVRVRLRLRDHKDATAGHMCMYACMDPHAGWT